MKKALPAILLGAAALAAIIFGKRAFAGKRLNVKIRSLRLQPISSAAVIVEIINPTSYPINFDSLTFDLSVNGSALSTLNYQKQTALRGNSSVQIALPIKLNPLETAKFAIDFAKGKFKVEQVALDGFVNSDGVAIPVNITQKIG